MGSGRQRNPQPKENIGEILGSLGFVQLQQVEIAEFVHLQDHRTGELDDRDSLAAHRTRNGKREWPKMVLDGIRRKETIRNCTLGGRS